MRGLIVLVLAVSACSSGSNGDGGAPSDADLGAEADADRQVVGADAEGDSDEDDDADEDGDDASRDADEEEQRPPWWGEPIEAPDREWTWVPFPDARCADGSATGLGVSLSAGAESAFIYLQAGGACWNFANCFGPIPSAVNLDGFAEEELAEVNAEFLGTSVLFDRDDPRNPFAEAHLVYVPYCTGDMHSGDNVVELEGGLPQAARDVYFVGHRNMVEYLARVVPTLDEVSRVVLSGSSAGGFGATLAWGFVQDAFGSVRVDLLDDSSPLVQPAEGRWELWAETWNMQVPEACVGCLENPENVLSFALSDLVPSRRYGLAQYESDLVVISYFGIGSILFRERLRVLMDEMDAVDGANYFGVSGALHIMFGDRYESTESSTGMPLWRWVLQMVDDDPNWTSYRP